MTVADFEAEQAEAEQAGATGPGAINFAAQKKQEVLPAVVNPDTAMTVADHDALMASRMAKGNFTEPPSYEVQMLTRDECLVTQLRTKPFVFQQYIAKFLNISEAQVVIEPPLLSTDGAPTPPPAAPAPGPAAPAPAPGPAGPAAAGAAGLGNRPWVAW